MHEIRGWSGSSEYEQVFNFVLFPTLHGVPRISDTLMQFAGLFKSP